jgi:hypothetical protein
MSDTPRRAYPRTEVIYSVRYERKSGSIGTKTFLQAAAAEKYANKLIGIGKTVWVFAMSGEWQELPRTHQRS